MDNIFLFAGQGAQYSGMGRDFYLASDGARRVMDTADKVLGREISTLCFSGSDDELSLTENTQPAVLAVDLMAYEAVLERGIRPSAVAGFSLGEYAALVAAGVLSIEEAFHLIDIRARAMQSAVEPGKGAMAAIRRCRAEDVEEVCSEVDSVWPVNYNSPSQIVISGLIEGVELASKKLMERKCRVTMLPVSAPFHTPLMENARLVLERELGSITFSDAAIPVYMNYDGGAHRSADDIRRCLLLQTVSPVRWTTILENIADDHKETRFIELGPGHTLSSFVKKTLLAEAMSVFDMSGLESL